MADFRLAVERTLALEGFGKLTDLRGDPGGLTKWGISQRAHPGLDIPSLTREDAIKIYRTEYWNPFYDRIGDQEVADEIFDFGVNTHPETATKLVQEAIRYLTAGPVVVDGKFGTKTLAALCALSASIFLREFRTREAYHYALIVINKPDVSEAEAKQFLLGWFRRVMA
jgi:lysozyme family protein